MSHRSSVSCCQSQLLPFSPHIKRRVDGEATKRLRIYLALLSFHCVSSCLAGGQPLAVGFVHTQPLFSLILRAPKPHMCAQKNGRILCKQRRNRGNVFFLPGNIRQSTQSALCNNNTTTLANQEKLIRR